jgi:hypothetical protein
LATARLPAEDDLLGVARTRSQAGYAEFLRWKSLTISHLDQRISGIDKLFAIRESLSQPIRIMIDPN